MAELRIEKRLIDYVGLNAKGLLESWLSLPKDIQLALVMLQGMGPDGAKLVNVDANGNLQVTTAGQTVPGSVRIQDGAAATLASVLGAGYDPAMAASLSSAAYIQVADGATWRTVRSASAAYMAAQSGIGAALAASPGEWSVAQIASAGVQGSVTRAAGGVGVRHVCKGVSMSACSVAAPVLTFLSVNLRDGASGAGALLAQWAFVITAAAGQNVPPFGLTGLNIVGSANTAMTLEWSALLANLLEGVSLSGYDAS